MSEAQAYAVIQPWLARVCGLPSNRVIRAMPDAPRPMGLYAAITLISARTIGWRVDQLMHDVLDPGAGEPALQIPVDVWEWTWSVNVFGSDAMTVLARAKTASHADAGLSHLGRWTIARTSDLRRLPAFIGERWEGRAQMDIDLQGYVYDGVLADVIEQVGVDFHSVMSGDADPLLTGQGGTLLADGIATLVTYESDPRFAGRATADIRPPPVPQQTLTGMLAGSSSLTGQLAFIGDIDLVGTAAGIATAAGSLAATLGLSGLAAGGAIASAVATKQRALTGQLSGSATVSATAAKAKTISGQAAGAATITATVVMVRYMQLENGTAMLAENGEPMWMES